MKVLILHHHFNTPQEGGAIRSYYLAKALVDKGIQTTVITTHNGKETKTENIEGIKVRYLPISYDNSFGFYKRVSSFIKYILQASRLPDEIRSADLCYTISVPLTIGITSMWIKKRYGIPFVFEVGDLWPDAPVQLGFVKNYFFQHGLFALEKMIYKHAKFIVALSPAIASAIQKKSPDKKIELIPNMADTDFFKPSVKELSLEKKFDVEGKFVISYIGALGYANGLDHYLECARSSQKASIPVHFLVCGDGAMLDYLKRASNKLQLNNLSFIPFQNREGVREVMNVTDSVFICYRPIPILETGSPNKYFDGLAAGKLIMVNFGGWIKEEIEREGCGCFVDPQQPTDFVRTIMPYLESVSNLAQAQRASRLLAEKKYSRKMLSEKFSSSIMN